MEYNVIIQDFNKKEFVSYNIFPYLTQEYKASRKKPKNYTEFKDFIKREAMRQWWSRCEYEIILSDWPNQCQQKKIDVHYQVMANLDAVTKVLIESINDC